MAGPFTVPCAYTGISPLYLRVYDDAYLSLNGGGWDWNYQSQYPMEYAEWRSSPANDMQTGCAARLFDLQTGYTTRYWGKTDTSYDPDPYNLTYSINAGLLAGYMVPEAVTSRFPSFVSLPLTYTGDTVRYDRLVRENIMGDFFPPPPLPNTGLPQPGRGINALFNNGIVYSSCEVGNQTSAALMPLPPENFAAFQTIPFTNDLTFPTSGRFAANLFYTPPGASVGVNYINVGDSTGGVVPYNFLITDFGTFAKYFIVNAQNPPSSSLDFNAFFIAAGNNPATSPDSWLIDVPGPVTIDGVTYPGLLMEIAGDYSSYHLYHTIGMDGLSNGIWNTPGNGSPGWRKARDGVIWAKTSNVSNVIYVATTYVPGEVRARVNPNIPPTTITNNPGLYR